MTENTYLAKHSEHSIHKILYMQVNDLHRMSGRQGWGVKRHFKIQERGRRERRPEVKLHLLASLRMTKHQAHGVVIANLVPRVFVVLPDFIP